MADLDILFNENAMLPMYSPQVGLPNVEPIQLYLFEENKNHFLNSKHSRT